MEFTKNNSGFSQHYDIGKSFLLTFVKTSYSTASSLERKLCGPRSRTITVFCECGKAMFTLLRTKQDPGRINIKSVSTYFQQGNMTPCNNK